MHRAAHDMVVQKQAVTTATATENEIAVSWSAPAPSFHDSVSGGRKSSAEGKMYDD